MKSLWCYFASRLVSSCLSKLHHQPPGRAREFTYSLLVETKEDIGLAKLPRWEWPGLSETTALREGEAAAELEKPWPDNKIASSSSQQQLAIEDDPPRVRTPHHLDASSVGRPNSEPKSPAYHLSQSPPPPQPGPQMPPASLFCSRRALS